MLLSVIHILVSILAGLNPASEYKKNYLRPTEIPFPEDNAYTKEKAQLGKLLFFDPRLSKSNLISCASCHNPAFAWTDGLGRGVGHGHERLGRKTPTVLNQAWGLSFFWDGRAETLEEQSLGPIQSPKEMNQNLDELVLKLKAIPKYNTYFEQVFPKEGITVKNIAKAIATYERTIVSGKAPFDRWVQGEERAISEEAKKGFLLFNTKANCVICHTGWNFTNGSFADTGVGTEDLGKGALEKNSALHFSFKTPSLRNIERRGPYMHDGTLATLEDVIEHYNKGGSVRRTTKIFLKPLDLSAVEKKQLVEFLKTLTSEVAETIPELPVAEEKR